MSRDTRESDVSEISSAVTKLFQIICNQLIASGGLNREALKAEIAGEVERIRNSDSTVIAEMLLSSVAFALHEAPPPSEATHRARDISAEVLNDDPHPEVIPNQIEDFLKGS